MLNHLKQHFGSHRTGGHGGLDIARHIGPGLLVTVGFIDPGNWASNMAAGSQFGYALLWIVTLSTIMLIVLQHNAAHLGIATGACLAEATTRYLPRFVGRTVLASAYLATIATAMAEVLGGAIALQMLFGLPVRAGCVIVAAASMAMLMTSSYKRAERWIIAFVGVVGLSFLAELALVKVDWPQAAASWITPSMPTGSAAIIVSVLGVRYAPQPFFCTPRSSNPCTSRAKASRLSKSVYATSSLTRSFRWAWAGQSTRPWSSWPQRPSLRTALS